MSWLFDVWISPTMRWSFFDSLVHPIAIYAQSVPNLFRDKREKENSFLSLLFDISCLYVQFRQAVDGILLQFIYGACIFLDVLQSAMPKDAGDSLDVVAIVEEVHSARMAGTVPTDMLVDAGAFHPSLH